MYRYKQIDQITIDLDKVILDPNEEYIPFSIHVLLLVCKSFLVIVRNYFESKGK